MAINDQPHISEIEQMMSFCKSYEDLYIFGRDVEQKYLLKFLKICGVQIKGFLVPDNWKGFVSTTHMNEPLGYVWDDLPVITPSRIPPEKRAGMGILMAIPGFSCNDICVQLQALGFTELFFMSDHNKYTIAHKLKPREKFDFWLEVNLADHCNLNCQMCDHFSPIATETFLSLGTYENDMKRLAELTNHNIGIMKLQGGEPLLNQDLISYIKITRKYFPKTKLFLFTDGLLLLSWEKHKTGNLWEICRDYKVEIQLTIYPVLKKIEEIQRKADEYGIVMDCFTNVADRKVDGKKFSVHHPFDIDGQQELHRFISCYQLNESIVLRDGKIYTCPMVPYVHYFNEYFGENLEVSEHDYIDIYKAGSYEEIAEFVANRIPFCRYCDVKNRKAYPWKQSDHSIEEWT